MITGVTGKTRICGLIGDPVEHTISPALHNAAFQSLGLDYIYVPFRVEPTRLEEAMAGVRALCLRGINVTIPHKVAVLPFLDEFDSMAENLGAVNTIVNNEGILRGCNTDAVGFYQALTAEGVDPVGKKITILGAGGAARAVSFILADKGAQLTILNRDESRAKKLGDSLMRLFRCEVVTGGLQKRASGKILEKTEILINTTSVGMLPQSGSSPIPSGLLHKEQVIFDIIYNPRITPLLEEAAAVGAKTIGGIEMLVQQGAAAFELWTGKKAPLEVMRRAALQAMGQAETK
jgi:shikimate dehydrogenase